MIGGAGLLLCAASVLYVVIAPTNAEECGEFDAHGLESTYTLLGAMLGLIVIWWTGRPISALFRKGGMVGAGVKMRRGRWGCCCCCA